MRFTLLIRSRLQFSVAGYHDKAPVLLMALVERLLALRLDAARFDPVKDAYRRSLQSFKANQPYLVCMHEAQRTLSPVCFSHDERLACLPGKPTLLTISLDGLLTPLLRGQT